MRGPSCRPEAATARGHGSSSVTEGPRLTGWRRHSELAPAPRRSARPAACRRPAPPAGPAASPTCSLWPHFHVRPSLARTPSSRPRLGRGWQRSKFAHTVSSFLNEAVADLRSVLRRSSDSVEYGLAAEGVWGHCGDRQPAEVFRYPLAGRTRCRRGRRHRRSLRIPRHRSSLPTGRAARPLQRRWQVPPRSGSHVAAHVLTADGHH